LVVGRTWGENTTSLKIEEGFDMALYEALAAGWSCRGAGLSTNSMMGHAGAIVVGEGWFEGASDPRCDGAAAGFK
jgi:gamma-glutamyltranspeptidase/glutathione hydrolase